MNFLDQLPPYFLPVAVGGGVALFALAFLVWVRTRRPRRDGFPPPPGQTFRSSHFQLTDQSYADRRTSVRREGGLVKILISSPAFKTGVDRGYVIDRSTGGLKLVMGVAMVPGSTMQVRAHNAPESIPWVTVIVRSSRHTGKHYEIGCEFDKTPPWNVLLLFG